MATDFRFNGQQSYSPLLTALAEAPQNAAKLSILKEQNQRARLSDLLTNMTNAATVARNIQLIHQAKNQIKGQEKMSGIMNQTNPLAGAASAANPDAFSAGLAGVQAPFAGLDSMMGGPQAGGQVPLEGEGVQDPKKAVIMNKLFPGQYELSTAPSGLRELVSKIPGLPTVQVDKGGTAVETGNVKPGEALTPTQKKEAVDTGNWLTDQVKEFKNSEVYKNAQITIDGARRMRALTKANIPLSEINIQAAQTKLAGINRLTEVELERSGIDPGLLPKYQQLWSKMTSRGFIKKNKDELNEMADVLEKVQQDNLQDAASSQINSMKNLRSDIPEQRHRAVINGAINEYMKTVKTQKVKGKDGSIDLGSGFTYKIK